MTISDKTEQFFGRPVADYSKREGLRDPAKHSYRIHLDYDEPEGEETEEKSGLLSFLNKPKAKAKPLTFATKFSWLAADPKIAQLEALLVGSWGDSYENTSAVVVDSLVQARDRLPSLRALFIGDMTFEECEISWIRQSDISSLYAAFPKLEWLQLRGGEGLELGRVSLPKLRGLVIETGGLGSNVLKSLAAADLPELEHLELWLGTEDYGWDGDLDDIAPLLQEGRFPKLRYLGLRDFEQVDELAPRLVASPVVRQVETLDLSLGNLSDAGAAALLQLPTDARLQRLDLHHHYLSDDMMARLQRLPFEVDLDDRNEPDEWDDGELHRYIAVSE